MGILFGFQADDITTKVIANSTESNSSIVITTPLTEDPISDAVNNVRFAANGFAADGTIAILEMRTRSFFTFKIPEASRITVHGHLTFFGLSTVTARKSSWLLDWPGLARFFIAARMRVRVRGADNRIVFTRHTSEHLVFDNKAKGDQGTTTSTEIASAGLLEEFLTLAPTDVVLPEDKIFVRMQYRFLMLASDGAEFITTFDANGGGLNVPMVVVNY